MRFLPLTLLIVVPLATYWPVVNHDFLTWDDEQMVYANARFNPPSWSNLGYYWTHPAWNLYMPVTTTTWGALARIARVQTPDARGNTLNPAVFHVANLLLHMAAVLIVYSILRLVVRADWPACAGAMLFAIHPIQVETVSWVGGINNQLAGLPALISLWCYLKLEIEGSRNRRWRWIVGGVCALFLATLAKPTAVVVPLLAVVIAVLLQGVNLRRAARNAMPWFLIIVPCLFWTAMIQKGNTGIEVPIWERPLISGDALVFYLSKLFWPARLAFDYGRTPAVALQSVWVYFAWIVPIVLLAIGWMLRRIAPALITGIAVFILALLPVLGLLPFDFQAVSTVADRYLYIAMLGPAIVTAACIAKFPTKFTAALAAIVLVILAIVSSRQVRVWQDDFSLYPHTLRINPNSFAAHNNFAATYLEYERPGDALPHAKRATELRPGVALAWINYADALAATGRAREAIEPYRRALDIQPLHAAARAKLALALASVGEVNAARAEFDRATRDDPDQRRLEPELQKRIDAHRSTAPNNSNRP